MLPDEVLAIDTALYDLAILSKGVDGIAVRG